MTTHKHLKARVRSRMQRTGESYAAARAIVTAKSTAPAVEIDGIRHFAGIHPETTALRVLATHAGVRDPGTGGAPTEEAMLAAGGGLGAGVFAFHYAREQFSSLFLAGRHGWEDGRPFMERAARRMGLDPTVVETGSPRAAERDLRAAVERGPVAAWVDYAELPYRAAPESFKGGGYHVLVVHAIRDDIAVVGDLAEARINLPMADLARARARIAKQKHRLLTVAPTGDGGAGLASAMRAGFRAGAEALAAERRRNFSLAAFEELARRMHGSSGAESWTRVFPRGRLLWMGLSSLHRCVETYFTGGGLLRPMAARAATQLAELTRDERLADVASRYEALGRTWSALAAAALPDRIPLLAETRAVQLAMADAWRERGADAADLVRGGWQRLAALEREADDFPMTAAEVDDHLADLADRLRAIHADEVAALERVLAASA